MTTTYRKIVLVLLCVGLLFLVGCRTKKEVEEFFDKEQVTSKVKEIVQLYSDEKFEKLENEYVAEEIKERLSAEILKQSKNEILSQAGKLSEITKVEVVPNNEPEVDNMVSAIITCQYENRVTQYTITLNRDYKIIGFYIK